MSKKEDIEKKTEDFAKPITEEMGFELIDTEYVKEASDFYLRIYIDKPGGVTIEDCVAVTEKMNVILDREDYIDQAYIFEVSSPGLLRPLKKDKDFLRMMDKEIEIHTYKPIDGCKDFTGALKAFDEESVTILTDEEEKVFNRKDISLIRPYIEF